MHYLFCCCLALVLSVLDGCGQNPKEHSVQLGQGCRLNTFLFLSNAPKLGDVNGPLSSVSERTEDLLLSSMRCS